MKGWAEGQQFFKVQISNVKYFGFGHLGFGFPK
jgi:hypothetical protein